MPNKGAHEIFAFYSCSFTQPRVSIAIVPSMFISKLLEGNKRFWSELRKINNHIINVVTKIEMQNEIVLNQLISRHLFVDKKPNFVNV